MTSITNTWRFQLAGMLAIVAFVAAVFWIVDGPAAGAIAGGWVLLFVTVIHFGRRRVDAINVIGGVGDERTRSLYTRAVAFAGTVMAFVLPIWWNITVLAGDQNETLAILSAVFAVTFIGAAISLSRRN